MNDRKELKEMLIGLQRARKKIAIKRSLFVMVAFVAILGASGCVAQEEPSEKEQVEKIGSADGKRDNTSLQKTTNTYVKATNTALPVEDLKKQALYTTTLTSESKQLKLFVLPTDSGETTVISKNDANFTGQEGEELYKGKVEFYLAETDGEEGYLQDVASQDVMLNVSQEPIVAREWSDLAIVQLSESVTSTSKELSLWTVQSGKLVPISVDGQTAISTSTSDLKSVDDRYIQTYDYFTTNPNGWAFRTYEWDPKKVELTLFDETELLVKGPFHYDKMEADIREYYQHMIDNWNRIEEYTYPFPHLTYPEDLPSRLGKGYLLDEQGTVGSSLKKYLEQNPNHLGEYDTEGGWYYAYPDGQSFYFDREDDAIQAVELSGGNYKETVSELKEMLGEPLHDSKNDPVSEEDEWLVGTNYDIGDVLSYEFGDYQVRVMYRDENVGSILLSKKME
ncbi:hypothetical protein [Sporosarcina sp. D27]|uniref:hypothetical protein n=1 Tax=Sporosarcina sp. D27 TaxID=1382305 RepID=UPI0004720502|nr:hypothetical protein [Sporosarcina sp. D27]